MKILKLSILFLFLAGNVFAAKITFTDLTYAVNRNILKIEPTALGGLRKGNLKCSLRNLTDKEIYIRISPGLHFKPENDGGQDLLTIKEEFITIGPESAKEVKMTGYCMNKKRHSPISNSVYKFIGYAPGSLKILSDSLARYPQLENNFAQMFTWAITDNSDLWNIYVEKKLIPPATNIMNFVADASNQPPANVILASEINQNGNPIHVFSKTAFLAYHNPKDQVLSFKIFDKKGLVKYVWFENKKIGHGLKEYTFGINDLIRPGETPEFYAKIIDVNGKVLAQKKIDASTSDIALDPLIQEFPFNFELNKGLKNCKLVAHLEDGTLVEEFKRYEYLPMGQYNFTVELRHLFPAGTQFVLKLVNEAGVVFAQKVVSN